MNLSARDLFGRSTPPGLAQLHRRKIFVADNEPDAEKAATLAQLLGYRNVVILAGGLNEFRTTIRGATSPQSATSDVEAFRPDAARELAALAHAKRDGNSDGEAEKNRGRLRALRAYSRRPSQAGVGWVDSTLPGSSTRKMHDRP